MIKRHLVSDGVRLGLRHVLRRIVDADLRLISRIHRPLQAPGKPRRLPRLNALQHDLVALNDPV